MKPCSTETVEYQISKLLNRNTCCKDITAKSTSVKPKESSCQKSCSWMSRKKTTYAHNNAFESSCWKSYHTRLGTRYLAVLLDRQSRLRMKKLLQSESPRKPRRAPVRRAAPWCQGGPQLTTLQRMSTHIRVKQGQLLAEELLHHVKQNHKLRKLQCLWELLSEELPQKTRKSITAKTYANTLTVWYCGYL